MVAFYRVTPDHITASTAILGTISHSITNNTRNRSCHWSIIMQLAVHKKWSTNITIRVVSWLLIPQLQFSSSLCRLALALTLQIQSLRLGDGSTLDIIYSDILQFSSWIPCVDWLDPVDIFAFYLEYLVQWQSSDSFHLWLWVNNADVHSPILLLLFIVMTQLHVVIVS